MAEGKTPRQCIKVVARTRQDVTAVEVEQAARALAGFWVVLDRLGIDPGAHGREVSLAKVTLDLAMFRARQVAKQARRQGNRAEHARLISERGW